jgi:HSP20 family protein
MLVKREIHPALGSLFDNFFNDNVFGRELWETTTQRVPSANIKELDDRYLIELATPGFKKEDFEISVQDRRLVVKSKNEELKDVSMEKYIHKEYFVRQFSRSFSLSDSVDADNIIGRYEDGILQYSPFIGQD